MNAKCELYAALHKLETVTKRKEAQRKLSVCKACPHFMEDGLFSKCGVKETAL